MVYKKVTVYFNDPASNPNILPDNLQCSSLWGTLQTAKSQNLVLCVLSNLEILVF